MHLHDPSTSVRSTPAEPTTASASILPQLTEIDCIQLLEVRRDDDERELTITAALAADAIQAICTALSEQLDRNAQDRAEHAEDVLTLREHTTLVERFQALAAAEGHAVAALSQAELRTCLLELTRYAERVDDEHYQDPDLRARLEIIRRMIPVLWEANTAAAASGGSTRREPRRPLKRSRR
jgi:hypothetical protein